MSRDDELREAATRVQERGPITDYIGAGPYERELRGGSPLIGDRRLALCRCAHGKEWPEGDRLEDNGGAACRECVKEWHDEFEAEAA